MSIDTEPQTTDPDDLDPDDDLDLDLDDEVAEVEPQRTRPDTDRSAGKDTPAAAEKKKAAEKKPPPARRERMVPGKVVLGTAVAGLGTAVPIVAQATTGWELAAAAGATAAAGGAVAARKVRRRVTRAGRTRTGSGIGSRLQRPSAAGSGPLLRGGRSGGGGLFGGGRSVGRRGAGSAGAGLGRIGGGSARTPSVARSGGLPAGPARRPAAGAAGAAVRRTGAAIAGTTRRAKAAAAGTPAAAAGRQAAAAARRTAAAAGAAARRTAAAAAPGRAARAATGSHGGGPAAARRSRGAAGVTGVRKGAGVAGTPKKIRNGSIPASAAKGRKGGATTVSAPAPARTSLGRFGQGLGRAAAAPFRAASNGWHGARKGKSMRAAGRAAKKRARRDHANGRRRQVFRGWGSAAAAMPFYLGARTWKLCRAMWSWNPPGMYDETGDPIPRIVIADTVRPDPDAPAEKPAQAAAKKHRTTKPARPAPAETIDPNKPAPIGGNASRGGTMSSNLVMFAMQMHEEAERRAQAGARPGILEVVADAGDFGTALKHVHAALALEVEAVRNFPFHPAVQAAYEAAVDSLHSATAVMLNCQASIETIHEDELRKLRNPAHPNAQMWDHTLNQSAGS